MGITKGSYHSTNKNRLGPMKTIEMTGIILSLSLFASGPACSQTDSISDLEGNVYKTVAISTQWWMAENLKVTQFANGDPIPHLTNAAEWAGTEQGAYCYYGNSTSLADSYGNLYNWYTVEDDRGVCPVGWHVATDADWITMEMFLGMSAEEAERMTAWRGTDEGSKLKDESFEGNNSSGFTALATGYRDPAGVFKAMGTDNDYWTSTPYDNKGNVEGVLHGLLNTQSSTVRNFHVPGYGFCIRCVRDEAVQVKNQTPLPDLKVFPNPTGDQLNVHNADGNHLTIRNLKGQAVLTESVTSANHQVDMSSLSEGIYLISISGQTEVQNTRVVVL